ncbi:hypothetical protein PY650_36535, partial [Rhizobium calliandrae]
SQGRISPFDANENDPDGPTNSQELSSLKCDSPGVHRLASCILVSKFDTLIDAWRSKWPEETLV